LPSKKANPNTPDPQLGLFSEAGPGPISKTEFIAGWQCQKYLWFERHERGYGRVDAMAQFLMQQGTAVGKLAQGLFPDAQFEVTAQALGALARADILRQADGAENLWDLFEVKTSGYDPEKPYAEDKQEFIWDLALQVYVFEASGKPIRQAKLVLVNKDYVRKDLGPINPHDYFIIEDVTQQVRDRLPEIPGMLEGFQKTAAQSAAPDVAIGMHCKKPHDCPYQDRCFEPQGSDHIFKLRNLWWKDKFKLWHSGVKRIQDYPASRLEPWQAKQVAVLKSQQPLIDKAAIAEFITKLQYPVHHLDFETCNPALPPFAGIKPFRQTVFQYSLHIQDSPGAEPRHFEYLPEHLDDPRTELLEKMLAELGTQGSILAYYADFEKGRLKELAEAFPAYAPRIEALLPRFQDLEKPFSNGHYVHPGFGGRTSIKVVLPTLVPEMSYDGMPVSEGTAAIRAYLEILDPVTSPPRRAEIRRDLRAYCAQDTLAMVRILKVLEGL
jgi:hypothetical protein